MFHAGCWEPAQTQVPVTYKVRFEKKMCPEFYWDLIHHHQESRDCDVATINRFQMPSCTTIWPRDILQLADPAAVIFSSTIDCSGRKFCHPRRTGHRSQQSIASNRRDCR